MRYWWVNQNQTFGQETRGGYLWSPKRNANDHRNPFYEFMREVAPGDVVFSFYKTRIHAIGIAGSFCYECPKPAEFGSAGPNWSNVGWKVDVRYTSIPNPMRPADHMQVLAPLLAERYAPLRPNGHGLQGIYLTTLGPALAEALLTLMGSEARALANDSMVLDRPFEQSRSPGQGQTEWEEHLIGAIREKPIEETVTCVPSRNHLPFHPVVQKVRNNEPQKRQQNRFHRCQNLDGAFGIHDEIPAGSVLLVDDILDSGWTMTVVAALLRRAGCGAVFPLALASTSTSD